MNRSFRRTFWAAMLVILIVPATPVMGQNPYLAPAAYPSTNVAQANGFQPGPSTVPAPPAANIPPQPTVLDGSGTWRVPSPPPSGDMGLAPPTSAQPVLSSILDERFMESSWYTRVDYFHWNEKMDGEDFVNEYGNLITIGYAKTIGCERFRGEIFGGTMRYLGGAQFDDGSLESFFSTTGYVGLRGEYDLLFEPAWWPETALIVGLGTRFWVRDLHDGYTPSGVPVMGYQESWWTFYPYIGLEKRRSTTNQFEFFSSAKVGCTPFTYEHVTWGNVSLYPTTGLFTQVELGFRGRSAFISTYFEVMTWSESDIVRDSLQPASSMVSLGMKAGFSF